MFLAIAAIAQHLRNAPHFQSWDVRDGMDLVSRQDYPAADVRILGAGVEGGSSTATVSPSLSVRLIVERSDTAAATMDGAFNAAFSELHGLQVTDTTGRTWARIKLSAVRDLPVADGFVGCELIFVTDSEFTSKHCEC
ncbi:MAG: hypothetical protein EOO27_20175 [Comamonadaceae bacterium]|nr:MAG: hypothetical protein EOO27_20175 [Comamonadaceae bacterium]